MRGKIASHAWIKVDSASDAFICVRIVVERMAVIIERKVLIIIDISINKILIRY